MISFSFHILEVALFPKSEKLISRKTPAKLILVLAFLSSEYRKRADNSLLAPSSLLTLSLLHPLHLSLSSSFWIPSLLHLVLLYFFISLPFHHSLFLMIPTPLSFSLSLLLPTSFSLLRLSQSLLLSQVLYLILPPSHFIWFSNRTLHYFLPFLFLSLSFVHFSLVF